MTTLRYAHDAFTSAAVAWEAEKATGKQVRNVHRDVDLGIRKGTVRFTDGTVLEIERVCADGSPIPRF